MVAAAATNVLPAQVRGWRNALFVIFFACGIELASYLSRVPHVRDVLGASTFSMSLLALAIAIGSISGMTASSLFLEKFGARAVIRVCTLFMATGLVFAGLGVQLSAFWVIALALVLYGFGMGTCDVSMNLSGAAQEKIGGRTIMPIFHAFFSFGTMAGAALGALAERLSVPILAHLIVVAVVMSVAVLVTNRLMLPESLAHEELAEGAAPPTISRLQIWKQPVTLALGVVVLGMALAEGSANDWLALAMVDGHGVSNTSGAVALGVFLTAMTAGRIAGVRVLDRFGRVPVLRGSSVVAVVGLAIVIFSPVVWFVVVGIALWGLGAALGFPVGMSAAADEPRYAAARLSVVATVGYVAFLAGPPVIGFLGERFGLLNALLVVLAVIVAAGFASGAARERGVAAAAAKVAPSR